MEDLGRHAAHSMLHCATPRVVGGGSTDAEWFITSSC